MEDDNNNNNNNYEIVMSNEDENNNNSDHENSNDNNNNNSQPSNRPACAACKHQRKKCKRENCSLLKHFPAEKTYEFQTVHKVFGLANLTRMLKGLDEHQQEEAVKSVEWEALWWKNDQVHGPFGQFKKLEKYNSLLKQNLYELEEENQLLKGQINSIFQALDPTPTPLIQDQPGAGNIMDYYSGGRNLPLGSTVNSYTGVLNREYPSQAAYFYGNMVQGQGRTGIGRGAPVVNHAYNYSVTKEEWENHPEVAMGSQVRQNSSANYSVPGRDCYVATHQPTNIRNGEMPIPERGLSIHPRPVQQYPPMNFGQKTTPAKS